MHERTKNLLVELYALDPSLRDHEPALLEVLDRISAAKPDVRIDQAFLAELRTNLLATTATNQAPHRSLLTNLFDTMSKTPFILGGLATTAILVAVIVTMPGQTPTPSADQSGSQLAMADGVIDAAPGAFGELGSLGRQGAPSDEAANEAFLAVAPNPSVPPSAAVLGTPEAISARPMSGGGSGVATMDSKMMIAPYWPAPIYTLAYDQTNSPFEVVEQTVYRRSMDPQAMSSFVTSVTGRDNGLLDLAAMRDIRVERVSLFEDRTDGYQTELNLFDGSLYMNLDWRHTQYDPAMDQPIRPSEMPSDETLIAAADAFMGRFSMDRSVYGTPVVDKTWQRYMIMADGDEGVLAPSSMSVVYPLLVDGTQVAEFGGELAGPRVNIRVRDLKVMNLYGLTTRRFERSAYALETDIARLVSLAMKGGIRGPVYQPYSYDDQGNMIPSKEPTTVLRLGTPEQILMKMYRPDGNASVELYLPALRFPILNAPADPNYYGPHDVVVPLVKDILDEYERSIDQQPVPMPYDSKPMTEPAVLR